MLIETIKSFLKDQKAQSLVELLITIGLLAILFPALLSGFVATRGGRAQADQRLQATSYLKEAEEAIRVVSANGWSNLSIGTYHPAILGSTWILASGAETINSNFTRQIVISGVSRDLNDNIASSGGTLDSSTLQIVITVSWVTPSPSSVTTTTYFSRYNNTSYVETTAAQFNNGTINNTQVTNVAGGEVKISNNNKAKWCSPALSSATIDLPDGPPVAVAAYASATNSAIPNNVFVATAPYATSSVKLAYVNVTADTATPAATLHGIFTLDPTQYSAPGLVPSGINLTNSFKTNDVKYYTSSTGKIYALLATDLPDHEVIAVQVNNGTTDSYQDPLNHIFKYWTFFNTRLFNPAAGLDTGLVNPTSNSSDAGGDGDGFGTNPTRAYTDNNSFAVDTNSGNGPGTNCTGADKDKHRFYNYGFSIPAAANINGVEVRLDAKADSVTGGPFMCVQLSWNGGTTWTSAKSTTNLTTGEITYTLGGPSDNWGRTWTDTELSNANFRIRVIDVASDITRDFSLDWAAVKVYYSTAGSTINDQAPFDYGATSLTVLGNTGYTSSGGYLYTFDLSNIDSKSTNDELDQVGCRIQLDGYDCKPGTTASDKKYNAGETGTSWGDIGSPAHNTCADGGNIELYASNDIYPVQVAGNNYIFVAVGAGTNPEFDIVNATSVPTGGSSPAINNSSCGRISGGNAAWKMVGSKDFNTGSGTEEASNSVFSSSDGTRAYISSNGTADSKQFYILNTTDKTNPTFLSGNALPTSGYYQSAGANGEMYPRRSLTVLNGQRVILVGKDGVVNGNNAQEYQVLDNTTEATPTYCGGLNYDQGFNDLTSVSEADGDNFVYMVANTNEKQLKIIQGGPDNAVYVSSGTFESQTFNTGHDVMCNRFSVTGDIPAQTTLTYQVSVEHAINGSCNGVTYNYVGPDGTLNTYFSTSSAMPRSADGPGYENPGQCIRYKVYMSSLNQLQTPTVYDFGINYSP